MLKFGDERERLRFRSKIADLNFELGLVKGALLVRKAGFRPDQPRDEDGTWTSEYGESSKERTGISDGVILSDESPDPVRVGAQYAQTTPKVVIHENALTGISTIDDTNKQLARTLEGVLEVINILPNQTPRQYGVAVHAAFAIAVKAQNLPGIGSSGVELSFFRGDEERYGFPDSIRTDVTLKNEIGDPIAIYDVKTGRAELSASRIREIRANSGASSSVPIIQIQVGRGVTRKGQASSFQYPDIIYVYRWYPMSRVS